MTDFTDLDRQILDFEGHWWKHPGAKEQAIKDEFDMSATRFYQLRNAFLLVRLRQTGRRARGA